MPITIEWANPDQTIMLLNFVGAVGNDEILPAYRDALDQATAIKHPIHVIIDHTREAVAEENFADILPQIGELELPPNLGLIIQVGARGSTRARTQLYSQMYRKLHHVEMMEDAYALIKVYDERRALKEDSQPGESPRSTGLDRSH